MLAYYKQHDSFGRVVVLLTYDQVPNINNPLIVKISAEEYAAILEEFNEKLTLEEKLYTEKITLSDVPDAWREEIQNRVDALIANHGDYDAQQISAEEAIDIILGGDDA